MLDNEPNNPATEAQGAGDARPSVTTTRRRVASRPAGPPPDVDDDAAGSAAKKPTRARKSTAKTSAATAEPGAEVKVVKTTRRRAATRAAAPPPDVEESAASAAAPGAADDTAAPAEAAGKAKTTRRTRATTAAASDASADGEAPSAASGQDEASEPAVKVTRTTRRRAAVRAAAPPPEPDETASAGAAGSASALESASQEASEAEAAAHAGTAAVSAPAEDEGATKRSRTRRRAPRAADETGAPAVTGAEAGADADEAPAEEAPKTSRTRTRKRATVTADSAEPAGSTGTVPPVPGAAPVEAAEPQVDENEPASGVGVPGVTFQPPTMVVFQPPQPSTAPPSRRKAQEERPAAEDEAETEPETDERAEASADEQDEDDRPSSRRRRRRGGRGRGRNREGGEDEAAESEDEEPAETARAAKDTASAKDGKDGKQAKAAKAAPKAAEEQDEDESDEEGDESGASGSSRRRRRRRRRSGSEDGPADDLPPNTVVHVREVREAPSRPVEDEVQAVRGSTRLEAKKQRRREGREQGRRRPPVVTEAEFLARRESVKREMVVRQEGDRTQIAVLEDDVLVEHYINRASHQSYVGNVYLGKVQNVLPSMEAAFVDIGKGRNAVLYAGEVNWDTAGLEGQPRRIESALKSGQSVLVQVTKDPLGHKGARLTSQVSLPGRYLVYVPDGSMTGISRKLPDKERSRLKQILKRVMPENAGVIVRTAAEGATEEELARDVSRLAAQWEHIQKQVKTASAPSLLHGEPDLTIRVIRDIFNEDFTKLVVQGEGAWETVSEYVGYVAPHLEDRVEKWTGAGDVMGAFRIDEQIAKALDRKVWLPSGGSLVIDRTEAMTVIDVNTGKFTGQGGNLEETVTRNNLEAAEEIVRQLRLRDIGGIVVIDFIDMVLESNRDLVLRRLVECLSRDRTKHQVAEVTSLGLVQMTRKRVGQGLLEAFSETCESCNGRGIHVHLTPVEPKGADKASGGGPAKESGRRRKRKGDVERAVEEKLSRSSRKDDEEPDAQAAVEAAEAAEESEGTAPGALTDEPVEASSNGRARRRTRRATRPAAAPPEPAVAD
ncbi:ribonuclease E/G [Actinomadura rupiterrae]|uniref:ribonuclease E/G n=1 Tax=Actinomadura rupiterrae TaxID=559627 RepID=UPI0020A55F92|nr:ribonuclease E/G [Actinomadura rupiterrae]MCP2343772.1 ribonuclease E [Actinomadura rupiterrae]